MRRGAFVLGLTGIPVWAAGAYTGIVGLWLLGGGLMAYAIAWDLGFPRAAERRPVQEGET